MAPREPESATAPSPTPAPLLTVRALRRRYRARASLFSAAHEVTALDRVSFTVLPAERLGVVGESGSGKSTLARTLLALERPDSGDIRFGPDQWRVRPGSARRTRWFRARVQLVPQDPAGSLNPRVRVGRSIAEPLACLGIDVDHRRRVAEVLTAVGLDAAMADRYPHEFSGGQRQRLAIARAIAPGPRLLVADEPVSALDVSARGRVLELLRRLSDERGLGLVLISHDLGVVRTLCDRALVMRDGRVVEQGTVADVLSSPRQAYTRRLIEAIPRLPAPAVDPENNTAGGPLPDGAATSE
ncbi:peptide/nickel transport system ATP-binding protein [Lipingzhangella halophila]|uniref:Peptide/nickel transport system ATP-binding protein n=1 Tax=Lipingzhangella halophila TaxID=1783352 RepID=A0A7W7RGP4_9ACTN|nr:ABC transporter ATP-binding protein [Lipingzhangella halophila]MBB4931565.1 peptide/nickel transport system ATP-binding protein [Lipingzhangella halophila]